MHHPGIPVCKALGPTALVPVPSKTKEFVDCMRSLRFIVKH